MFNKNSKTQIKADLSEETKKNIPNKLRFLIDIQVDAIQLVVVITTLVSLMPVPIFVVNWQNQKNIERINLPFTNTTFRGEHSRHNCGDNHGETNYI